MLYGDRIRFRAIEKDDLPQFVAWLNDPEVIEGLAITIPMSLGQEEKWYAEVLNRPVEEHPLGIEAKTPEGWELIGNLGFFKIDRKAQSVEIGIVIGEKSYWNQGYGSEAVRLALEYGFNTLNFNRIALSVYDTNPRAIKAYKKAGFVLEGKLRQAAFQNGKFIDVLMMSVLRNEWREL